MRLARATLLTVVSASLGIMAEMCPEELECLERYRNAEMPPGLFCNATFDDVLCWPPTPANTSVSQACPGTMKGVDLRKLVHKVCQPDGLWEYQTENDTSGTTNYATCYTEEMLNMMINLAAGAPGDSLKKIHVAKNTRLLEVAGLSLSLASLFVSLFIFFHFRSLKNNRTKIHRNLFVAMVIQVLVRLVLYLDQVVIRGGVSNSECRVTVQGIDNTPYVCESFYILLEYARTAMFMWMFIEGLYLNTMISVTVFSPRFYDKFYYTTGWGAPVVMTTVWAVVTGLNYGHVSCWWNYNLTNLYWILEGPRIAVMVLNVAFLVNIIIVLVTKMRQSNSSEAQQVRKAVKAAVVLLPLLGVSNIINMVDAPLGRSVAEFAVWSYLTHFLTSFQGFFVSLLYCFLNGEVRLAISKMIYDYCSLRTADTYRRGSGFSSVFLTTVAEPARGEPARSLVTCGCVRTKPSSPACQGVCRMLLPSPPAGRVHTEI
ncbi:PDF receptor-like isoform X2 [Amphibalanus amphitrite]|uniref:PDF receptor-like isoform X2 n=1 Tax=Amphibalanus amphitrite TaxID=1232801 RepID=UPI001C9139F9|nr:PDF receptor-like isoform X2 [Amphibalanus amphitrite]